MLQFVYNAVSPMGARDHCCCTDVPDKSSEQIWDNRLAGKANWISRQMVRVPCGRCHSWSPWRLVLKLTSSFSLQDPSAVFLVELRGVLVKILPGSQQDIRFIHTQMVPSCVKHSKHLSLLKTFLASVGQNFLRSRNFCVDMGRGRLGSDCLSFLGWEW